MKIRFIKRNGTLAKTFRLKRHHLALLSCVLLIFTLLRMDHVFLASHSFKDQVFNEFEVNESIPSEKRDSFTQSVIVRQWNERSGDSTNQLLQIRNNDSFSLETAESRTQVVMTTSHVTHSPITINGDADLVAQALNEGWAGDGSAANPYVISGLDISGGDATPPINITSVSLFFVIQDNIIKNGGENGLFLNNVTNGLIQNNTIMESIYGIRAINTHDMLIRDNVIMNHYWDGIMVIGGTNNTITANIIQNNEGSGISLLNAIGTTISSNALLTNSRSGIYLISSTNSTIQYNNITENGRFGINFDSYNDNALLKGNTILNNTYHGILIRDSSNIRVFQNEISYNQIGGMRIVGNSGIAGLFSNISVIDNVVYQNLGVGIDVWRGNKIIIQSNRIRDNHQVGLVLDSSPTSFVEDNSFYNDTMLIEGSILDDFLLSNVSNNLVDGLPLLYIVNQSNPIVSSNVGELIMVNSRSIDIRDHAFSTSTVFVEIVFSQDINIINNSLRGIAVRFSNTTIIAENFINNSDRNSISVIHSTDGVVEIKDNIIVNSMATGILVSFSDNASILRNIVNESAVQGLMVFVSDNVTVTDNLVSNNDQNGMVIYYSDDGTITGNKILNNSFAGIRVYRSQGNRLQNNTLFFNEEHGLSISQSNGTIIISNEIAHDGWSGIGMDNSDGVQIIDTLSYNNTFYGFHLAEVFNLTIRDSIARNNGEYGIYLKSGTSSAIINNTAHDNGWKIPMNGDGLFMLLSSSNSIINNTVYRNARSGMYLLDSDSNIIQQTFIHDNQQLGLVLSSSENNTVLNNTFVNDGLMFFGSTLAHFQQLLVANNTVNGKMLLYLDGETRAEIPRTVGQVILVNSHRITIQGLSLHNTTVGIQLAYSSFITIYNNSFMFNQQVGLLLDVGTNDTVVSWNNFIYNNREGWAQARDDGNNNVFSYNYWSDGPTIDADNDGFIDMPYQIEGDSNSEDPTPLARPYSRRNMNDPTILTPNGGENVSGVITISWTKVVHPLGRIIKYEVYYSTDGGTSWHVIDENLVDTTSIQWNTSNIRHSTTVLVKVIAVDTMTNIATSDSSDSFFEITNSPIIEESPPDDEVTLESNTTSLEQPSSTTNDLIPPNLGLTAGIGLLLLLILGSGFFLVKRRRG